MWLSPEAKNLSSDSRINDAIEYAKKASIYSPESTVAEMTAAQTVVISLLYALKHRDVEMIKTLLNVSSTIPQINSSFLRVWIRDDFCFPRGDVAQCLSTLGQLLIDGLQFPWGVAATLASLNVKYHIEECFMEADDTAGQILLSTLSTSVSEGTQVDLAKEVSPKKSQTLKKQVSFQLPSEKTSTGTQAGPIVRDGWVLVRPEQTTVGVQTERPVTPLRPTSLVTHSIPPSLKERGVSIRPERSPAEAKTTTESTGTNSNTISSDFQLIPPLQKLVKNPVMMSGSDTEYTYRGYLTMPLRNQKKTIDHYDDLSTEKNVIQDYEDLTNNIKFQGNLSVSIRPEQSSAGVKTKAELSKDEGLRSGNAVPGIVFEGNLTTTKAPRSQETTSHTSTDTSLWNKVAQQMHYEDRKKDLDCINRMMQSPVLMRPSTISNGYPTIPSRIKKTTTDPFYDLSTGKNVIQDYEDLRNEIHQFEKNPVKTQSIPKSDSLPPIIKSIQKVDDGAKYFVDKADPIAKKKQPVSKGMANELLYSAIQKNDGKAIVNAINAGADVNHEGVMKKRPLHVAASAARIEPAIELIHWGADVNSTDNWKETPLFVASVAGHLLMAEVLIAAGADINHKNSEGNQPLHVAASAGQLEIVRLLVRSGAEVNSKSDSSRTALHYAAHRGHLSVVGLLLELGADPWIIDQTGHSPLSLAKSNQQHLVADFISYRSRQSTYVN